jgi:hypothetical protein
VLRAAGLAVIAAVAVCLASAAPAAGAEKAIWGPVTLPSGKSAFPLYRELGVDTFQIQLNFETAAPTRPAAPRNPRDPAYAWPAELARAVRAARRRHIDVAILVNRSPGWANGGKPGIWAPKPRFFRDFVTAASRRYPSVRRWMIWGEPNRIDRFQPGVANKPTSARAYARILDAAYAGLKRASRRNIVIGGMTWTGGDVKPAPFLRWLKLPSGRRPRLDWYGHNPFPFRKPDLRRSVLSGGWRDISDMDVFSKEVARAFPGRPRLWLSEFTVVSDKQSNIFQLFTSERQQASWLAAAYRIANRLPAVAGLGWLSLVDQAPALGSANWGLIKYDGVRKPAFRAFKRAQRGAPALMGSTLMGGALSEYVNPAG